MQQHAPQPAPHHRELLRRFGDLTKRGVEFRKEIDRGVP